MKLYEIDDKSAWSLFAPHHYTPDVFNPAARTFLGTMDFDEKEVLIGFAACLSFPSGTVENAYRSHKVVVLPASTVTGVWGKPEPFTIPPDFDNRRAWQELADAQARLIVAEGHRYFCNASDAPAELIEYRDHPDSGWKPTSKNGKHPSAGETRGDRKLGITNRTTNDKGLIVSHEYVGKLPETAPEHEGSAKKPWELHQLLSKPEADELYQKMMAQPWRPHRNDGEDAFAVDFGVSYDHGGGACEHEVPDIPDFLRTLADRISAVTKTPINYIQCHKFGPASEVKPHKDPKDMIVPMLVVGQERTFRVGGTVVSKTGETLRMWRQQVTPPERHVPEQEQLLRHGSLLIFNGGQVTHSMFPAAQDSHFNANGCDCRISIIFRYTTVAMREHGPGEAANQNGHPKQYRAAVAKFQALLTGAEARKSIGLS